jgi:nucleoporin POM152
LIAGPELPANESCSASHQDSCKSVVTDISKTIHALPRARVHAGNTYIENIREGDQAEIIFEFEGTPPFSFTYTKSAPASANAKGKKGASQVLETHTITGVETNRYSVFTQSEGTWNVVSVQDKYCAYPPLARSDRRAIKNS